jgi:hypothetical protein
MRSLLAHSFFAIVGDVGNAVAARLRPVSGSSSVTTNDRFFEVIFLAGGARDRAREKHRYMADDSASFFELQASDDLVSLITPAAQYLLAFLAQRDYRRLWWLSEWSDELLWLGRTFVEFHFIKYYDGLFAEYFYDLKRVLAAGGVGSESNRKLSALRKAALVLLLVGVPYLKQKLDRVYQSATQTSRRRTAAAPADVVTTPSALERVFCAVYPYVYAVDQLLPLVFALAFMFERTAYYSPVDWLSGTKVVRIDERDVASAAARLEALRARRWQLVSWRAPLRSIVVLTRLLVNRAVDDTRRVIAPV